jgi:hypothetical protein
MHFLNPAQVFGHVSIWNYVNILSVILRIVTDDEKSLDQTERERERERKIRFMQQLSQLITPHSADGR